MFLIFKRNNAYLAHQNSRDVYLLYKTLKIEKVVLKFVKKKNIYVQSATQIRFMY